MEQSVFLLILVIQYRWGFTITCISMGLGSVLGNQEPYFNKVAQHCVFPTMCSVSWKGNSRGDKSYHLSMMSNPDHIEALVELVQSSGEAAVQIVDVVPSDSDSQASLLADALASRGTRIIDLIVTVLGHAAKVSLPASGPSVSLQIGTRLGLPGE